MSQALSTAQPKTFPAQLDEYQDQLRAALPTHVSLDRFKRTVLTAVNQTPKLLEADRRSLFNSAVKCATDGLLPDGREAALVEFGGKIQYMPMVRGLIKLARQSGEISTLSAHIVREGDEFEYVLGDDERLVHKPNLDGAGKPRLVYATVTFKDGTRQREVLTVADVEKVRAVSRAKNNGPWVSWWDEMARKTAIRRLLKYVTLSADVQRAVDRDDETEFGEMRRTALRAIGNDADDRTQALNAMAAEPNIDRADLEELAGELEAAETPAPDVLADAIKRIEATLTSEDLAIAQTNELENLRELGAPDEDLAAINNAAKAQSLRIQKEASGGRRK